MALWIPGPLVQSISGRLGGAVFHAGSRANVISRPAFRCDVPTAQQSARRAALKAKCDLWLANQQANRDGWDSFAATHPIPDRLGRSRRRSGKQWYLRAALALDPLGDLGWNPTVPHAYAIPTAPAVTASAFTAGGPYNLTVTWPGGTALTMGLTCQRFAQYGPRPARNARLYIGHLTRSAATLNWYPTFQTRGVELLAGETVTLYVYDLFNACLVSPTTAYTLTVS